MVKAVHGFLVGLLLAPAVLVGVANGQARGGASSFDDAAVVRPETAGGQPQRPTVVANPSADAARGASLLGHLDRGTIANTSSLTAAWVAAGFDGTGVSVGIIDFFDNATLSAEIAQGEVPSVPVGQRFCRNNGAVCAFGRFNLKHGNAIAETIADNAPGAQLYLAEVETQADYYSAIDWFAANGVRVLNHSLVGAYDGPGDGTGPSANIVDYAVSKGMAWFNTSGDSAADTRYTSYQGGYWRGLWSDPNGNRFLNFKGVDETLGTYCGALMGLRWSDWGAARTDYELWIGDYSITSKANGVAVLASDNNQAAGAAPLEGSDFRWLCNTDPAAGPVYDKNKDGFVGLKVKRSTRSTAASATGDLIELQVLNGWFEYASSAASAAIAFADSKNLGEGTVAAEANWGAQGPTNDNRIKPDLTAGSCAPTLAYGDCATNDRYESSDIATAYTSGVAAVALGALGPMQPWQLVQYLRNTAPRTNNLGFYIPGGWVDLPNNKNGYGLLRMRGSGPFKGEYPKAGFLGVSTRLFDTRVHNQFNLNGLPVAPNSAYSFKLDDVGYHGVTSVVLNVTITQAIGPGYVQVGPGGSAVPGATSNLNVERAGQTLANVVVTTLGPEGEFTVYTRGGGHVIVDLLGIFERPNGPWPPSGYVPLDPFRAYDSRCVGCTPITGGTYRDIPLAGIGTGVQTNGWQYIPTKDVFSVVVSVTADSPVGSGYISAVTTYAVPPMATSTANYQNGATVTGLSIVQVQPDMALRVFASTTTNIQVDVLGYFSYGSGGLFTAINPARAIDTRQPSVSARPTAGADTPVDLQTVAIPPSASAVMGNLTTTHADGPGLLKIGRNAAAVGGNYRNASVVSPGQVIASSVITALDGDKAHIVASNSAHRILDVSGWFTQVPRTDPSRLTALPSLGLLSGDASRFIWTNFDWTTMTAQVMSMDIATGVSTPIDITPGTDAPNQVVVPAQVNNTGDRFVVMSTATNLAADDTNGAEDFFIVDTVAGTVERVKQPDGQQFTGQPMRFAPDLSTALVETTQSWDATDTDATADVYELDLDTHTTTFEINLPANTSMDWLRYAVASSDLSALFYNGQLWRRGVGLTTSTFDYIKSLSPGGRYIVADGYTQGIGGYVLHDNDAQSNTPLCTDLDYLVTGPERGVIVDWSAGLPTPGEYCATPTLWLLAGAQSTPLAASWTGMAANGSSWSYQVANGFVAFTSSATNVLPGITTSSTYLYDEP